MSVGSVHVVHGIDLATGQFICQLSDTTPRFNTEVWTGYAAGESNPLFQSIRKQRPEVPFTSPQLRTLITMINAGTPPFCRDLSGGNTDVRLRAALDFGSRDAVATTTHYQLRMAQAFFCWQTLRAAQDQEAEMSCRLIATWNGSANPIVPSGPAATSGTSTAAEQYTLGPIKVNGTFMTGVQEISIDNGDEVYELAADGDIWASFAGLKQVNPVLTVKTLDAAQWLATMTGVALSSNCLVYLRRKQPDVGNYSDASLQHILITIASGMKLIDDGSYGVNKEGVHTLRFLIRSTSAAVQPYTFTLDSAIA